MMPRPSRQPDVEKEQEDGKEESEPHFPANAGALCHPQHTIHISAETNTSVLEGVIEVRYGGGIPDLVANSNRELALGY